MAEEKDTGQNAAQTVGKAADKVGEVGGGLAGEAVGTKFGGPVGGKVGKKVGQTVGKLAVKVGKKLILFALAAVIGFTLVIMLIIVTLFAALGLVDVGEAVESDLQVKFTAEPSQIALNGSKQINKYILEITNNGTSAVSNFTLTFSDPNCPVSRPYPDILPIAPGETRKINFDGGDTCLVDETDTDHYFFNEVTVTASLEGVSGGLDYTLPFLNTSINVVNEAQVKNQVANNPNWPNNYVFTNCGGGVTCWDYLKQRALAGGVNPAFALAVWISESGASHYSGHLSCPDGGRNLSHTISDFKLSVDCFIDLANNFSSAQFPQMIDQFCDPATPEICYNPAEADPNLAPGGWKTFPQTLKSWYEILVPQGNPGALTGDSNLGGGPTVSGSGKARIKIGSPSDFPSGCPIIGPITTPKGTNIPDYPGNGVRGNHGGVDISSGNSPVRTTLTGTASLQGSSSAGGGYAVRVDNGEYAVSFHHLMDQGRVSGEVSIGDVIGIEDSTGGQTTGNHVHYIIYKNGVVEDPIQYLLDSGSATINYTPPVNLNFASIPFGQHYGPQWWGTCHTLP